MSKHQLQSILGLLLYVHKCVKPARIFLNRMLDLLRSCHGRQKIRLTSDFKRDLRWFAKFLPTYNGILLYDHRQVDVTLELDACLTGFGGRSFCLSPAHQKRFLKLDHSTPRDGKHSHSHKTV